MNIENEITRLKRIVYFLQRKVTGDGSLNAIIEQIQQDILDLQNSLVPNTGTYATGQILVNLLGGLQVQVIWPTYYIDGTEYAAGSGTVTLTTADATDNRFDAIILNTSGLSFITGIPSATPEQPTTDSTSQLLVTYILVEANQTDLTDNDILIYDEGTETTVTGNGTIDDQSTAVTPISGTYVLSHGSFNSTNYIDFTFGADQSIAQVTQIKYFIRLISAFSSTTYLKFTFFKSGAAVSNTVNVVSGSYNFLRTTTGSFQVNIIPIGAFNFSNGLFDKIRITFNGSNASGFYLDFASLQVGVTGVNPIYNFFKTILDEDGLPIVASQPNDTLQIIGSTKTGDKELTVSGGGGGHTIQDEGTPLTQRTNLNFVGSAVAVTDDAGNNATVVTISGGTITVGDTQVLYSDGANNPTGEAAFTYNKTTNRLNADYVAVLDDAYDAATWNGNLDVPTKNAVRDKIESLGGGITGSGTSGYVTYWTGASALSGEANLYWDATNDRLGIGTSSPLSLLRVTGSYTAATSFARGIYLTPTLIAAANNDSLIGLNIISSFTDGGFTGLIKRDVLVGDTGVTLTATPVKFSLGGTYGSNTAGNSGNLKFILYDDATTTGLYGIGFSGALMEIQTSGSLAIYGGGTVSATKTQHAIMTSDGNWTFTKSAGSYTITVTGDALFNNLITTAATFGDKINLFAGTNYGFGVQSNLLQIYSPTSSARTGIGYGSSASFTEVLTVKGANVGINNNNPTSALVVQGNATLSGTLTQAASTGSKINLYSGFNYGFGVQSNLLQIFSDSSTTRTGIGFGSSASFTETLSIVGRTVGINVTAPTATLSITQIASTSGSPIGILHTGAAHTGLTASAEIVDVNFNLARTVQRATGAVTTQRAFRIQAPTYSFVGSSTITTASTLAISNAPQAGTNATITNAYALNVEAGKSFFGGNIELTQTVTTETVTSDTTVTIVINGTTYKLLAKA